MITSGQNDRSLRLLFLFPAPDFRSAQAHHRSCCRISNRCDSGHASRGEEGMYGFLSRRTQIRTGKPEYLCNQVTAATRHLASRMSLLGVYRRRTETAVDTGYKGDRKLAKYSRVAVPVSTEMIDLPEDDISCRRLDLISFQKELPTLALGK
jgi:hypothetical protein